MTATLICADVRDGLRSLESESVQCCITSPPYFGLRSYLPADHPDKPREIGQEQTPAEYVAAMVDVFREVRRVLKPDGVLWINIGDSYAGGGNGGGGSFAKDGIRTALPGTDKNKATRHGPRGAVSGIKPKDLIGIPWILAFALRDDGWWLRQDNIWGKTNAMPESVTDRTTRSHEYVFQLTKSATYFYDHEAIKTPFLPASVERLSQPTLELQVGSLRANGGAKSNGAMKAVGTLAGGPRTNPDRRESRGIEGKQRGHSRRHDGFNDRWDAMPKDEQQAGGANRRSVWMIDATGNRDRECLAILESELSPADKLEAIKAMMSGSQSSVWRFATQAYRGAHYATFPEELPYICIRASSREGDVVLDPFCGTGTAGVVALRHGRSFVGIDLDSRSIQQAHDRIRNDAPLLNVVVTSTVQTSTDNAMALIEDELMKDGDGILWRGDRLVGGWAH